MPVLATNLEIPRCPHCQIDRPNLSAVQWQQTRDSINGAMRMWGIYACARCGGLVVASSGQQGQEVWEIFPAPAKVDDELPPNARAYLEQAVASLHAPAGAVMLAASSVDAMLKTKGYIQGSLKGRIDKSAEDHLITAEMAAWAHDIRLDANDQRHADEGAPLPTADDARKCIDFAVALGQFLFVLPARVARGRAAATTPQS